MGGCHGDASFPHLSQQTLAFQKPHFRFFLHTFCYESATPVLALMTVHNGSIICLGGVIALGHKKTNVSPCARVLSGSEH